MHKWDIALFAAVVLSLLALVTVRNQTRELFKEVNQAEWMAEQMKEEFEILEIRKAELSNAQRAQQWAQDQKMTLPELSNTHIIKGKASADPQ